MKKYFIDSNIFLRFLDDSSKQHEQCRDFLVSMENNQFKGVICSVVLLEIYFILRRYYRLPKKDCRQKIVNILQAKNLSTNDNFDYNKAMDLFYTTGVKLPDCLIASLSFFKTDGAIISYDKDFDKLKLRRLEPSRI